MLQIGEFSRICQVSVKTLHHYDKIGYEIAGAPFELYIKTQFDSYSPEDWETEVYFPVRKK